MKQKITQIAKEIRLSFSFAQECDCGLDGGYTVVLPAEKQFPDFIEALVFHAACTGSQLNQRRIIVLFQHFIFCYALFSYGKTTDVPFQFLQFLREAE